ncbi:MAG: VOC family protein [Gemmatimonadales bacterium]|jgi:catechol 2,3-dioxygenase-like lactoylglutathione lyase family enzyme
MAQLDHIILKVNDLGASIEFYTRIMGFQTEGQDGPFTVIRTDPTFQMQLAPWGTPGFEHYAFSVTKSEFEAIFERVKASGMDYGPTFDSVGSNSGPGMESGAMGEAPTLYFNDPNDHLIEIRAYETESDA